MRADSGSDDSRFHDWFSAHADRYAECRPRYPAALAQELAARARHLDLAWDAGCGTGQLSCDLAAQFARVVATDASAQQIAHARAHPRVEYRVELAENPSVDPQSVDLCVAAQSAHWFDVERWFSALARVLRPGALIALVGYGRVNPEPDIAAPLDALRDDLLGPFWPPERSLVESGYQTLALPWQELPPLPPLWIEVVWDLDQFAGYVRTWSATRALCAVGRESEFETALGAFARCHGTGPRRWRWPVICRLGHLASAAP